MTAVPSVCPTCGTPIPEGRTQCPGCRRVFGEDNRCPACNAIAGVRKAGDGYVCVACGKPRELLPGTTVLAGDAPLPALRTPLGRRALGDRATAATLRLFGGASIGGGVLLAAAVAVVIGGPVGLAVAGAVGLGGVLSAVLSFRAAGRRVKRAEESEHASRELAVLALAEKNAGVLTATDVARAMSIGTDEAEATLTRMAADGERVGVDVDAQGVVRYVFRELRAQVVASAPQVRVETDSEAVEAARDEQERTREAGRK